MVTGMCRGWRKPCSESGKELGVLFLSWVQAFEGTHEERARLGAVLSGPTCAAKHEEIARALKAWIHKFEVRTTYVNVQPYVLCDCAKRLNVCIRGT